MDLAARNVLLHTGNVCKIADFGLTRKLEEHQTYWQPTKVQSDTTPAIDNATTLCTVAVCVLCICQSSLMCDDQSVKSPTLWVAR